MNFSSNSRALFKSEDPLISNHLNSDSSNINRRSSIPCMELINEMTLSVSSFLFNPLFLSTLFLSPHKLSLSPSVLLSILTYRNPLPFISLVTKIDPTLYPSDLEPSRDPSGAQPRHTPPRDKQIISISKKQSKKAAQLTAALGGWLDASIDGDAWLKGGSGATYEGRRCIGRSKREREAFNSETMANMISISINVGIVVGGYVSIGGGGFRGHTPWYNPDLADFQGDYAQITMTFGTIE